MMYVTTKFKLFYKRLHSSKFLSNSTNTNSIRKPLKLAYNKYDETITTTLANPPLLIFHGLFGNKTNWHTISNKLLKKLNPVRPVYVFDLRNHGNSPFTEDISYEAMTEDIKLFVDNEINEKKFALMGHSLGGLAVTLFALKWPEMVEKLIIIDISPIVREKESLSFDKVIRILKSMSSYQISKKPVSLTKERQNLYTYLKREIPSKRSRQFLIKNLIRTKGKIKWQLNIPALIKNSEEFLKFPNLIGQKSYKGPTCIIAGGDSHFLKKSDYPDIKKLFPDVEFNIIENAGHWVHYEKQDEFIKIVTEKLNK